MRRSPESTTTSSIDGGTGKAVGAPIPVGERPGSIAITPNGRRAVVVSFSGASATVIETATRTPVGTISLPQNGERVAISPDGKSAYVTDESDEEVRVVNPETAKLVGNGSLYKVQPLTDTTTPLLMGTIEGQPSEPIAWTNLAGPNKARVFNTTFGHEGDFANPVFRKLLVNSMFWALEKPYPVGQDIDNLLPKAAR